MSAKARVRLGDVMGAKRGLVPPSASPREPPTSPQKDFPGQGGPVGGGLAPEIGVGYKYPSGLKASAFMAWGTKMKSV